MELQKTQRQLQAKTKEMSALAEEAAQLKRDKEKLEEELKLLKRRRAEERMASLTAVSDSARVYSHLHSLLLLFLTLLLSPPPHL